MKRAFIIGIGAGDPDYLTIQAINAMNEVDVFFVANKGSDKQDLLRLRQEICERYVVKKPLRFVEFEPPARQSGKGSYTDSIEHLNSDLELTYEALLRSRLEEGQCAGFLVWGDPALYDSTIRILARIRTKGEVEFDYEVIPGITSLQALAARHKVTLNRIGGPIEITTGRRLAEEAPANVDSIVVMLDSVCAFRNLPDKDVEIYWGAYIGTEDEILVSGKLRDVMDEIEKVRAAARQRKGWIMDTYLLKSGE